MSATTVHHHTTTAPKEDRFHYTNLGPLMFGLLIAGVIGLVIALVPGFLEALGSKHFQALGWKQFLFSWLFAFTFFFTISAGSLFWIMLHYAVDAEWSVVVRRILETMANTFSVLWVFFIPIAIGAHLIYEWMNIAPGDAPVLDAKRAMLNPKIWAIFAAVIFSFFFAASYTLRWLSTRQDRNGDPGYTTKARKVSFASIPLFGVLLTAAAIFWVMSIEFEWYSTMWGVYIFAGSAWSSMATLILITRWLQSRGHLLNIVSTQHYHIMGKLLLSFTVFWAYIAFDQFFLIWYANIPEETHFFLVRNTEGWNIWAMGLEVAGHFFITFALLCPRIMKTNPKFLSYVCGWVLLMHACDIYFIVNPFLNPKGINPLSMVFDLAALVAIGAPLVFVFLRALGKHNLYAMRDPRLPESLRLVN